MNIWEISEGYLREMLKRSPISGTYFGDHSQDHLWSDFSAQECQAYYELEKEYLKKMEDLDINQFSPEEWVAYRVLKESLGRGMEGFERGEHYYDLNTISSTFQIFHRVFDVMGRSTEVQWRNIVARLKGAPTAMEKYQTLLKEAVEKKKLVSKEQVRKVVQQARTIGAESTEAHSNYYTKLVHQMKRTDLPEEIKKDLDVELREGARLINKAFRDFAEFLEEEYLPHGLEEEGVGMDRYKYYAENLLGTRLDPLETYQWGWDEYHRIEDKMTKLALKINPNKSLHEVLKILEEDETLVCQSQEEFRQIMLDRQLLAIKELDGVHFDIPEQAKKIEVQLAPPGSHLGASYQSPSEDFSRPGSVWYSFGARQRIPYYHEVSTAYHEGFPGHHLQICIVRIQEKNLSRFHRLCVWYPGYGEGWALYAEKLMGELGYYEKKAFEMGMLKEQLKRAFRVIVDIGMHLSLKIPPTEDFHPGKTWNAALGEEFMIQRVFIEPNEARDEIARYLGWPAQAICYKVGEKVFLELREHAKSKLKEKFNLRWFHKLVLENGPVSLDMLKEMVEKEVEKLIQ